jgi:hypothetical protein
LHGFQFPEFSLAGCKLDFVKRFRYRGHIIHNCLYDDGDIDREVKALLTRTNIPCRRFKRCSTAVKLKLFRSYCTCLYDASFRCRYTASAMNKPSSCYKKSLKSSLVLPNTVVLQPCCWSWDCLVLIL